MAKNIGAQKNSKHEIISCAPSVNKTQVGPSVVPIPYPVSQKLSSAAKTSSDVKMNGNEAYIFNSNSSAVKGDAAGKLGGVKSGTVEAQSDPLLASNTVKINNQKVIRAGDLQYMQNKNTIGKVTISEKADSSSISDNGVIEGKTTPDDLNLDYMNEKSPYEKMMQSSSTKPTASNKGLGSRTGSPVIVNTGQSTFSQIDISLEGSYTLNVKRSYYSREEYTGMFGNHWFCENEKSLININESSKRLYLDDARRFDFIKDEKTNKYIDLGNLGLELKELNENEFSLEYFNGKIEIYKDCKLQSI